MRRPKVILLQLPLQEHDFFCSKENIPLASSYLLALGRKEGFDVELLPRRLMSYGSDQAILQSVVDAKPHLVGMTCYLWNIERSLFLSREIKKQLPDCKMVLGGPEVSLDNDFLLRHPDFDMGVIGEGEAIWKTSLSSFPHIQELPNLILPEKENPWRFNRREPSWVSLSHLPSPYLTGSLDPQIEEVLYLETLRGCSRRRAYCYYHKWSKGIRIFPSERILTEIKRAREKGVKEVVFLDPCFTQRPNLESFLEGLIEINPDKDLHFHAEGNVEEITPLLAKKMGRAGFEQLEVGLQSVKRSTLKEIHRGFNPERFRKGVTALQEQGIEVMVDVIAGLPGDSLSDIKKSLDWVLANEACDFLMLYALSLIPGSELRRKANRLSLSFLNHPPYLLTKGPRLRALEVWKAFQYYSTIMEMDASPLEVPLGLNPLIKSLPRVEPFNWRIEWSNPKEIPFSLRSGDQNAYALTLSLSKEILGTPHTLIPILQGYLKKNPFTLMAIEVPPDVNPEQLHPLWELAQHHHHLVDRDYTVGHTPFRSLLLVSQKDKLLWKWPDPRESCPIVLSDGQEITYHPVCLVLSQKGEVPRWFHHHLQKRYPSLPEIRRWELPED